MVGLRWWERSKPFSIVRSLSFCLRWQSSNVSQEPQVYLAIYNCVALHPPSRLVSRSRAGEHTRQMCVTEREASRVILRISESYGVLSAFHSTPPGQHTVACEIEAS